MEIQFTIKILGSSGNKAVLEKGSADQTDSANQVLEAHSLEKNASASREKPVQESRKKAENSGKGGQGDGTGTGGGGSGMGSVIVIGPIVITGAASSGDIEGGQGDGTGTGGQGNGTGTGGSRSQH